MTDTRNPAQPARDAPTPVENYRAAVETDDDGTTTCTIYSTAPADTLQTTWISADGDSFCSLAEMR